MRVEKYLLPVLLAGFALPTLAANHTVIVGQNGVGMAALAFNPPTLSINAGDTVTFTNFQNGLHNVDSTGGPTTFKCSVDCVSNNAPNTSNWSQTVTFPSAGTVTYQCDQHAGSGMTGSITVNTPITLESFDID